MTPPPVSVGNYIAPRPAQYALRRIEDFEYIELWYLTTEGCSDATQHQLTQHDDAFGLAKVDNMNLASAKCQWPRTRSFP